MNKQNSKIRWVIFVSVLFTYLIMASQRTAPGLITDQLMADFSVTAATIGLVTSIQFLIYTSLQIPMGMLADRYGPNFFLIVGTTVTGIGTILYSLSAHEFVLLFARVLTAIGDATIWVNMVLILSVWFNEKEFTRLIGFAGMTGSLGFLLASVPFSILIETLGWRGAFLTAGLLLCLCATFLYFLLIKKSKQTLFVVQNKRQLEKTSSILRRTFSNRQAWALFFCHFGIVGGYIGFIGSWAVPYTIDVYGMTRIAASQLIMVSLIGALIGAPLIGLVSSYLETIKRPYIFFHFMVLLCWSTFLLFKEHPPFYLLVLLFFLIGFGFGSNSLTFAVVRQTFPITESGIVTGFANTGGFLSAVILPYAFGYILDFFHSTGSISNGYYFGFITPVIISTLGLIGVTFIQEKYQDDRRHRERKGNVSKG